MSDFTEESLMKEKDLYALLGIKRSKYIDEYEAMDAVKKRHAEITINNPKESETRQRADAIYAILKDDDKRSQYNKKHNIKFGFEAMNDELEEEMLGSSGKPKAPEEKSSADKDTDTPKEPKEEENKPQPQMNFTGESKAYNDLEYDLYGNPKKKKEEKPSSAGGGIQKPKREAPKSGGGGKNIMDVFWNEIIVPAYTSCLAGATDLVLDFFDYVLFDAYIPQSGKQEKKAPENKTIWDIGLSVYEKYESGAKKGMNVFHGAHEELMENIEQAKTGIKPRWKVWPGKKAPSFFDEMVEISKKADADPNSPEAELWKKITTVPEVVEGLFKKELLLRKLSISMATMDVALKTEDVVLPKDVTKGIQKFETLNLSIKDGKIDEDKYKREMRAEISEFKKLITEDNLVNKELNTNLSDIEKELSDVRKPLKEKAKLIGQKIENMKNAKLGIQEKEIDEKGQTYYDDIRQNIEKIKEIYAQEPEKATETINNYLKSVTEATTPAMPVVDKFLKAHNLGQTIRSAGKKVEISVKKFLDQDIPLEDTVIINKMKEKAEESLKTAKDSVSEFIVEGQAIGSRRKAEQENISPFNKKYGIFNLYKTMSGR